MHDNTISSGVIAKSSSHRHNEVGWSDYPPSKAIRNEVGWSDYPPSKAIRAVF